MMYQISDFLQGKKTVISSVLGLTIGLLYYYDYITPKDFEALTVIAGSLGLFGIRSAMRKFEKK